VARVRWIVVLPEEVVGLLGRLEVHDEEIEVRGAGQAESDRGARPERLNELALDLVEVARVAALEAFETMT